MRCIYGNITQVSEWHSEKRGDADNPTVIKCNPTVIKCTAASASEDGIRHVWIAVRKGMVPLSIKGENLNSIKTL